MRLSSESIAKIRIDDIDAKIPNEQILVGAGTGSGKSLFVERILENYHNNGYLIISLTDVKDEIELGYAAFQPKENYHLKHLSKQGDVPKPKKVKLYHPLTTKIPRETLPEVEFYGIPLKNLGRDELSILTETDSDTEIIKNMQAAIHSLPEHGTIWDMVLETQKRIKSDIKRVAGREVLMPKAENMWTEASSGGTRKTVGDIVGFIKPFEHHYFLTPQNFQFNLDVKKIFRQQDTYHIFTSFLEKHDKKIKDFATVCVLSEIIRNIRFCNHPILFLFEEITRFTPYKAEGYKKFMSSYMKDTLITVRNKGRGVTTLSTAQIITGDKGIDDGMRQAMSQTFLGRLNVDDIERLTKMLKWKRETVEQYGELERGKFIWLKHEAEGAIKAFLPSHCHAEESYNFFEMYQENFPDKTKRYDDLRKMLELHIKENFDRVGKMVMAEKEREIQDIKLEQAKAEEKEGIRKEIDVVKYKRRLDIDKGRQEKMELAYKVYQDNLKTKPLSMRELGELLKIDKDTVSKYMAIMFYKIGKENNEPVMPTWISEQINVKIDRVRKWIDTYQKMNEPMESKSKTVPEMAKALPENSNPPYNGDGDSS